MGTHPIDVIGNAIRARRGLPPASGMTLNDGFGEDVAIAVTALTDRRIVAHAAAALRQSGWTDRDGVTAEAVARVVLRSVGGE